MTINIGNPAPLGLLAFGMTTMMLMYVDMGWVEKGFEEMVCGYALFYGGIAQLLVGIFELFKGSSFSFAVFGSYGAFWLGWGLVYIQNHSSTSEFSGVYVDGKTAWFVQWGVLTFCFWLIALRKNLCLITVLGLLWITFFLLASATANGDPDVKKAAGYCGFLTAIGAWYTAIAELVNEEFGCHVLPGLKPILAPERQEITKEYILKRTQYDAKSNTMFIQFRGLQIKSEKDLINVTLGLEEAFQNANAPGDGKAHVVVDYEDVFISDDMAKRYWEVVADFQRKWYLSAKRFHVSSFGTGTSDYNINNMQKIGDSWHGLKAGNAEA